MLDLIKKILSSTTMVIFFLFAKTLTVSAASADLQAPEGPGKIVYVAIGVVITCIVAALIYYRNRRDI